MIELFAATAECLAITEPERKCTAVDELWRSVEVGDFELNPHVPVSAVDAVGRPDKPELVDPSQVKRRRLGRVRRAPSYS